MSFWVSLIGTNGEPLNVDRHSEGGTFVLGGTSDAELNVTYNYGKFYREHLNEAGLRWLDGKRLKMLLRCLRRQLESLELRDPKIIGKLQKEMPDML